MSDRERDELVLRYLSVREETERLAAPLSPEDQQLQSMPSCSPTKWHLAHTTWFFETFVVTPRGVPVVNGSFGHLFNSYYEAAGTRHPRPKRGLLSRPSSAEVTAYRRAVDGRVVELVRGADAAALGQMRPLLELGMAHEQQHQELLLTDILHAFSESPLSPVYSRESTFLGRRPHAVGTSGNEMRTFEGGLTEIGTTPKDGFAFDNEGPRHRVFLEPFSLMSRVVGVAELRAFIGDGGYESPSLWLSEGFDFIRAEKISAPQYIHRDGGALVRFALDGERELGDEEPVLFVSHFEADAIARYLGGRLPTEAEWEHAVRAWGKHHPTDLFDPSTGQSGPGWEWTASAYTAYPRFKPVAGALGEYNGKFMSGQMVLRGGSDFTPKNHLRASYRNFWPPATRFQRSAVRVARDA